MTIPENDPRLTPLIEAARRRSIGRRRFMEGALSVGATVAAASSAWGARVQAYTPRRGGTFRVGVHDGGPADRLDPATWHSVLQIQIGGCAYSYLTKVGADTRLGPDLATEWFSNARATEWVFRLDPRASFHNGDPVTADDVVASINHHRREGTASPAQALLREVTDLRAEGARTVVFETSTGVADLPYLLGDHHLAVFPATEDGQIDWRSGIGSGPYRFVSHDPGIRSEFVRHEGWHGADDGAWFDAVTMLTLTDAHARDTALVTGQVDAITAVDLKTYGMLGRVPGLKTCNRPSGSCITLGSAAAGSPLDDADVRRALRNAIDREDIVEKVFFNNASVGNDTPLNDTYPHFRHLGRVAYDPERAAFHLRKAGLEGLGLEIETPGSLVSAGAEMAALIAAHARAAGIDISFHTPADGSPPAGSLRLDQWGGRSTPDAIFSLACRSGARWNAGGWSDARFEALLVAAKGELDPGRRADIYADMGRLLQDDGPLVIPVFPNRIAAMRENLHFGDAIAVNWELDGARAYERWWFA